MKKSVLLLIALTLLTTSCKNSEDALNSGDVSYETSPTTLTEVITAGATTTAEEIPEITLIDTTVTTPTFVEQETTVATSAEQETTPQLDKTFIKYDYSNFYFNSDFYEKPTEDEMKDELAKIDDKFFVYPRFYSNKQLLKEEIAKISYDLSQKDKNIYEIVEMLVTNNFLLCNTFWDAYYSYEDAFKSYQKLEYYVNATFVEEVADDLLKGKNRDGGAFINDNGNTKLVNVGALTCHPFGYPDEWGFTIDLVSNGVCFFSIYSKVDLVFEKIPYQDELFSDSILTKQYVRTTRCAMIMTENGWRLAGELYRFDGYEDIIFKKGFLFLKRYEIISPEVNFSNLYKEVE